MKIPKIAEALNEYLRKMIKDTEYAPVVRIEGTPSSYNKDVSYQAAGNISPEAYQTLQDIPEEIASLIIPPSYILETDFLHVMHFAIETGSGNLSSFSDEVQMKEFSEKYRHEPWFVHAPQVVNEWVKYGKDFCLITPYGKPVFETSWVKPGEVAAFKRTSVIVFDDGIEFFAEEQGDTVHITLNRKLYLQRGVIMEESSAKFL
jgi:hypothetical protein